MNFLHQLIAVAGLAVAATASAAGVDIGGNNEQNATLKNSPLTALAIGAGSKSENLVNGNDGNVKIGGNNKQSAVLTNSPMTALAIGALASASNRVNSNRGGN